MLEVQSDAAKDWDTRVVLRYIWVSRGGLGRAQAAQAEGKAEAREGRSPPCAAQPLLLVVVHQNNHRRDRSDQILSQNPGVCKAVGWIIDVIFSAD